MNQHLDNYSSTPVLFDVPVQTKQIAIGFNLFLTIVFVGLLLNCAVIVVIGSARQLRYPRHLIWAFVSLADCLFLTECLLEVAVTEYKLEWACQFFVIIAGVDYSILLVYLSLAALDRYVAIAHYEWYKKCANNKKATLVLTSAIAISFLAMTSPFWLGYISYTNCTINLTLLLFDFTWDLFLGVACVILHVLVFIKSRKLIQQTAMCALNKTPVRFAKPAVVNHPPERLQTLSHRLGDSRCTVGNPSRDINDELLIVSQQYNTESIVTPFLIDQPDKKCFPMHFYSKNKFSRLEIRAAFNMSVNILPFWLCTFPVTVNVIAMNWCLRTSGDCTVFFQIGCYLRDLFMLHAIYNPIMYISGSSEFRRAVWHSLWKLRHSIY